MIVFLVLLLVSVCAYSQHHESAAEVLEKSIRYHDPANRWQTFHQTLNLEESRPNGTLRQVSVTLDILNELFTYEMQDGEIHITRVLDRDSCSASLNGSVQFSKEEEEKYRLSCDRIKWYRNYYLYLYGLPMKLKEPGTNLADQVMNSKFLGKEVLSLKVTYDESVGNDIWYFYFDPTNYRLVGYRFYHDESKNDGEYITLEDEYKIGEMRLPKIRKLYFNKDQKYLGTDTFRSHE